MANTLAHLIYTSHAVNDFNDADLLTLLKQARKNNSDADVTGILLYCDQTFFQILEGEKEDIDELFSIIKQDHRHDKIVEIINEPIPSRSFADWSMGFVSLTNDNLNAEGLNNFFKTDDVLQNLTVSRSKKILEAFSKGYWRNSIR